jgi:hypothetical protein
MLPTPFQNRLGLWIFLLLACGLGSCSHASRALANQENWLASLGTKWREQNPGKPYSIQRVHEPRRHNSDSLRFEIRSGEAWVSEDQSSSFRTEVNTFHQAPMNSENWYGFSLMLPKDFPIEDNRLVLAQWWALTKEYLGEVHRSPPLQLRYADGRMSVRLRTSDLRVVKDPEAYREDKLFETRKFQHGIWNDFVFHVKWSFSQDGFIRVWWNGKQVVDYVGRTTYNDDVGPKFKFGLYRNDSKATYVSYMSEVREGASRAAVDPSVAR